MSEQICSAFMCSKTYNDGVELYNFPEDYNPSWILAVNRGPTWTPKPTSLLCSDHFHEDAFELDENAAKRILKLGSEPFLMKGTSPEEEENKPFIVPKHKLGEMNTELHENKELIDLRTDDPHDKDLQEFDKEDQKNVNNITNGLHFDQMDSSLKMENPELSGILETLQKMRNELHDLEVEVKKRSGESWSDTQFQNIFMHVKNVQEELESYMKKNQIKSDAAAIPKLEPIDHFPEGVFRLPFDPAALLESNEPSLVIRRNSGNLKNSDVGKEELKEFDSEPEDENYDDANYDDTNYDEDLDFDYNFDKPKTAVKKRKTQKTKTSKSTEKKKKLIVKCVLCGEESCSKWLKTHVLESHGEGPYNCTKCGQTRDTYNEVRKHIKNHFQSEMVKCDICQKEISRQGMSAHKRSHTDTEEPCKKCGKYIMPIYMGRHMKEAHEEWRHLKCDFCEKKFAQPDHLKVHLRMHTGERPYSCETCGKSFKQGPHLRTHIKIVHEGQKLKYNTIKAMCGTCGKILLSKKSLQRHERTHTGEKPFKCEKCDKAFTQMSSLTSHRDVHNTSRLYSCEKCGKSMKFKQTLTAHMKIHEPGYVAKTYTCEACSITYKAKLNLRRHIRVFHEGIKPYPCEVCKQAFSNTTTLKQHMRVHTGEKPFHCDICNKSFTQASSLYSHKKKCN